MNLCQPCDLLLFGISTLIALFPYVLLFIILRPSPVIGDVTVEDGVIRVPVSNPKRIPINMLRVEVCALVDTNLTLHMLTDLTDFMILFGRNSPDNERVFKVESLTPSAQRYVQANGAPWDLPAVVEAFQDGRAPIRVRVHGFHAISGLGRARERITSRAVNDNT